MAPSHTESEAKLDEAALRHRKLRNQEDTVGVKTEAPTLEERRWHKPAGAEVAGTDGVRAPSPRGLEGAENATLRDGVQALPYNPAGGQSDGEDAKRDGGQRDGVQASAYSPDHDQEEAKGAKRGEASLHNNDRSQDGDQDSKHGGVQPSPSNPSRAQGGVEGGQRGGLQTPQSDFFRGLGAAEDATIDRVQAPTDAPRTGNATVDGVQELPQAQPRDQRRAEVVKADRVQTSPQNPRRGEDKAEDTRRNGDHSDGAQASLPKQHRGQDENGHEVTTEGIQAPPHVQLQGLNAVEYTKLRDEVQISPYTPARGQQEDVDAMRDRVQVSLHKQPHGPGETEGFKRGGGQRDGIQASPASPSAAEDAKYDEGQRYGAQAPHHKEPRGQEDTQDTKHGGTQASPRNQDRGQAQTENARRDGDEHGGSQAPHDSPARGQQYGDGHQQDGIQAWPYNPARGQKDGEDAEHDGVQTSSSYTLPSELEVYENARRSLNESSSSTGAAMRLEANEAEQGAFAGGQQLHGALAGSDQLHVLVSGAMLLVAGVVVSFVRRARRRKATEKELEDDTYRLMAEGTDV